MMLKNDFFAACVALASLCVAQGASAGMTTDAHGNVGYDTVAECDAAVAAGTAKFYQPFVHVPPKLRAGEARVKALTLKDIGIPQGSVKSMNYEANDYKRGACDMGVGSMNGQYGVAKSLHGKYIPFSPDMPVNVYYNKAGQAVRLAMKQCNNRFASDFPRPVPSAPVAMKPASAPVAEAPMAKAPVVPAPVPAPVQTAIAAAKGAIGMKEVLGVAGALAIGAVLIHNSGDTGTSGTTGTTGTN